MPDSLVDALNLPLYNSYLLLNYADNVSTEEGDEYISEYRSYGEGVKDASGNVVGTWGTEASRTQTYESLDSMNGLISYLAIYIGFVLVLACAAGLDDPTSLSALQKRAPIIAFWQNWELQHLRCTTPSLPSKRFSSSSHSLLEQLTALSLFRSL